MTETVMRLYRRGRKYNDIAKSVGISEKTVGRIIRKNRCGLDEVMNGMAKKGREYEAMLWYALAVEGLTLNDIAHYVGVSIQYVEESITPYLE